MNNKPLVVDMLDLHTFNEDTQKLLQYLESLKLSLTMPWLDNLRTLLDAESKGKIKLIRYLFGTGQLPSELRDIDLAINCVGPPTTTIREQISTLAIGGRLITTSHHININDDSYRVTGIIGGGKCVERIK